MLTQNQFNTLFAKNFISNCDVGIIVFNASNTSQFDYIERSKIFSFAMTRTNLGVLEDMPTDTATVVVAWDKLSSFIQQNLIKGHTVNVAFSVGGQPTSDAVCLVIDNVKVDYDGHKATITLTSPYSLMTTYSINAGLLLYDNGQWVGGDLRTFPAHITDAQMTQHLAICFANGRKVNPVNATTYTPSPSPSVFALDYLDNVVILDPINIYEKSIKRYYDENDRSNIVAYGVDDDSENLILIEEKERYYYMVNFNFDTQYAVYKVACEVYSGGQWVTSADAIIDSIFSNGCSAHSSSTGYSQYRFKLYGYRGSINVPDTESKYLNCMGYLQSQTAKLSNCQSVARAYYGHNIYYEFDCRIDPRIEPQDNVYIEGIGLIRVEEVTINFNGGFNGHIKGRFVQSGYPVKKPVLYMEDAHPDTFDFTITNNNPFEVVCYIYYSQTGRYTFTINANSTLTCTNSNCPLLYSSFYAKQEQMLNDYVTCKFDSDYGDSTSTTILEAD